MVRALPLCVLALVVACGGDDHRQDTGAAPAPPVTTAPPAAPPAPAAAAPRRDALTGGPYPALLVAQAQFVDGAGADGKKTSVPGPAKLMIMRETVAGWTPVVLEDPDSNVFHKALPWDDGILTIGGNQALLRTWRFADGAWTAETHWNPTFGGKFDRLRDVEQGDVDGDGKPELVIATHDQGVIAIVHPDEEWRVEEIDRTPNTFVHEIEIGDVDGDGAPEYLRHAERPEQARPGAAGRGAHVSPHAGRLAEVDRRRARRHARQGDPRGRRRSGRCRRALRVLGGRRRAGQHARAPGDGEAVPLEGRQARGDGSSARCRIG